MGKKNKKDKKGQGKEKTLLKTEKKASKRLKKELAVKGEVSIVPVLYCSNLCKSVSNWKSLEKLAIKGKISVL